MDLNGIRESRSNVFGPDAVLSNQNQSAPRVVSTERKVIESHSGRRQQYSVEVLKQKYLNDDIQDIPRLIQGPVRYGRLHRSRSKLNLGSQDIRTQLNKIRLRMGSNHCGDEDNKDDKTHFRCTKLKGTSPLPRLTLDSIGELLYGTPNTDDYDPELAALFEDYVEECDNPTRITPVSEHSLRDRYVLGRILMERVWNADTRYAFLSGFLEGMDRTPDSEADTFDKAIENNHPTKEVAKDPCIDQDSHIEMIKSNQDITHKFLKEWEQNNRTDEPAAGACFACHQEQFIKRISDSAGHKDSALTADGHDTAESKRPKKRNTLALGKPELDLAVPDVSKSASTVRDQLVNLGMRRLLIKKLPKLQKPDEQKKENVQSFKGAKIAPDHDEGSEFEILIMSTCVAVGKAGDATSAKGSEDLKVEVSPSNDVHVSSLGDNTCRISPNHCSHAFVSGNLKLTNGKDHECGLHSSNLFCDRHNHGPECNAVAGERKPFCGSACTDDGVGIIALAKQKLENKHMSSALLEDFFRQKQEKRQNESAVSRAKREGKDDIRSQSKAKAKAEMESDLGDLDGWVTNVKDLSDPDNLHVSSSEVLHPVSVNIPSAPATPVEQKDLQRLWEEDDLLKLPRQPTPTSAKLSDLDFKNCRKGSYETKAFKHGSPLSSDFKKAASHVKLRLTKSCANMLTISGHKDKAFANVPLSTCSNYYVEEKFKSDHQITANNNLSDKFTQQLKHISRDKGTKGYSVSHTGSDSALSNRVERSQSTSAELTLPSIEQDSLKEKDLFCTSTEKKIILPDISKSPYICDFGHKESRNANEVIHAKTGERKGRKLSDADIDSLAKSTAIDLPPISVKSYQKVCATPIKNDFGESNRNAAHVSREFDALESYPIESLAVRAEVCTSPYQFDKADANKLMVKAKSLPNQHTVCECCGGISEKVVIGPEDKKVERPVQNLAEKVIHEQCSSQIDDKRWKLDKTRTEHSFELPKLEVAKILGNFQRQEDLEATTDTSSPSVSQSQRKNKKAKNEELTFKFMGQNIKFRFECEFNVDSSDDRKPSKEAPEGCKRLQEISKPACRDNFKNTLSRETGVYKTKKKPLDLADCRDSMQTPGRDSPYVAYCKRKAEMRSKKQTELDNELAKLPAVDNTDTKLKASMKRFPVQKKFPVQKRIKKKYSAGPFAEKKTRPKETPHSNEMASTKLIIQPGRLPLLKTTSRTKVATGIQRQASTEAAGRKPVSSAVSEKECLHSRL